MTLWTVAHQAALSVAILQARILEGVAMPSSRGSYQPRDQIWVSCIAGGFFTVWATKKAQDYWSLSFLQGIFLTQESNWGLLHCRHILSSWAQFSLVQSLSHVWLFATPWSAPWQTSLSITNSQSLLKLMSIESVMPSNHLILCRPLLFLPSILPSIKVFSYVSSVHQVAKVLEFQLQHQSFQWIFRTDSL